jgi:TRAP-type C4-dicarboxylate transport system substrate-binding protein
MRTLYVALLISVGLAFGPAEVGAQTHTLKLATVAPKGTPWAKLLINFKRAVEKKSKGRLVVKLYLGGTMGDENATVRQAARGRIQGVGVSTGSMATLVPELNAVEIPFMFRSAQEADYVLDKKLTGPMEKLFRDRGLVLGFWSENGFRHFGSTDRPINNPSDLRNRKMRSQESFVHIEMWKALSSSAQAIPTTEVITALKTGTVDGFDQALLYAIAAGWHNSIKHLTLSGHIYQPAVIAYNKDWFDGLPKDLQTMILAEGRKLVRAGRASIRKLNPELVQIIAGVGVKIHKLSPAARKKFEKETAVVRERFRATQGRKAAKILDLVEAGVAEYRARAGK